MKSASMIDINGDGRTDILLRVTESRCSGGNFDQQECVYEGFKWTPRTRLKLFVSNGAQLVSDADGMIDYSDVRAVDLNGDGYTDILYRANNVWHYRLSDGKQFQAPRSTGLSVADNLKHLTYFVDLNGDGRTDILLPTSDSNWAIYLTRPSINAEQVVFERRGSRAFDANAAIQFADINADAKLDLLTSTNDSGWKTFLGVRADIKDNVIKGITNGWGVKTSIEYKNITSGNVYFRQSSSNNISSDYFSPRAGLYVVSHVNTQTTATDSVGVDYQYGGLLLHKKGRGLLGFEVLRTTDRQTNVVTETVYHQLWPYTGIPKSTSQAKGAVQLAFAQNTVNVINSAYGGKFPYIASTEELSYQQGSDGLEYALAKTLSSFSYDSYGNLTSNTITQSGSATSADRLVTTTTNTYGSSAIYQRFGRLMSSVVRKQLFENNALTSDVSRESAFTYYPTDLMLETETLSPADNKTKTTTRYSYDAAGNITAKAVTAGTNASGSVTSTRTDKTIYDSRLRYVKQTIDATGYATDFTYNSKTADSVTGIISYVNAVNAAGQSSRQYFDVLGRQYRSYQKGIADSDPVINSVTSQAYCSSVSCNVAGAYVQVRQITDGQAEQLQYLDKFGRAIATKTQLPDGTWSVSATTYDSQGRPDKTYEPEKGSASALYSQAHYDALGRVESTSLASGGVSSVWYQGLTVKETDPNGKTKLTTNNYLGQNKQVEDHLGNKLQYLYDAYGNLRKVTAVSDSVSSVRTENYYDTYGRKYQMADQDKGNWTYVYNGFGELLSQTDANGQLTSFAYDAVGRQLSRHDPNGTTCWDYGSSAVSYNLNKLIRVRSFEANVACNTTAMPAYEEIYSYNSRGLVSNKLVRTAGSSFSISSSYDSYNRLHLLTYPSWSLNPSDDVVIKHQYAYGALTKLIDNKTNRIYQQVTAVNARGQATGITYANGATESRSHYAATGWLDTLSLTRSGTALHSFDYDYDYTGNVKQRDIRFGLGSNASFTEDYLYDELYRLKTRTISNIGNSTAYSALPSTLRMAESYTYDNWGNIKSKTNVGYYSYDVNKTNRLTGVWSGANGTGSRYYNFSYDANGNVKSDGKRSFAYTAFDKPLRVTQGANTTDFSYGPDRQLYRRIDIRDNKTTDTLYIDGAYERTVLPTAVTEHKFYVGNAVITKRSNGSSDELYLHKDNQGSTTSITNAAGAVVQQFIYDPWGKQYSVSSSSVFTTYSSPGTSKGYTGHNMINDFEVIHMGGRTYNPILGRFMQADPFIQAPSNLQNYNRYSYVLNNPMSYTDPSGYFFKWAAGKLLGKTGARLAGLGVGGLLGATAADWLYGRAMNSNGVATVVGVALNFVPYCQVWCSALFSAQRTYHQTGSLKAAFHAGGQTAAMAGVFYGIGQYFKGVAGANGADAATYSFGGLDLTAGQIAGQIAAHAVAGGVISDLQGGKFGHGFFSAGVTKGAGGAFLPGGSDLSGKQVAYSTVVSAVIGGTASEISGGKFSNGAKTAAFQYLYNQAGEFIVDALTREMQTWRAAVRDLLGQDPTVNDDPRNNVPPHLVLNELSVQSGRVASTCLMMRHPCSGPAGAINLGAGVLANLMAPSDLGNGAMAVSVATAIGSRVVGGLPISPVARHYSKVALDSVDRTTTEVIRATQD